jgi:hypothetical protein
MGFLLKIVIFAVAAYGIWTTANRWFNFLGGNRTPAPRPPNPSPTPPPTSTQAPREKTRIVEDTHPCPVCGAYVTTGMAKCSRSDCPQP